MKLYAAPLLALGLVAACATVPGSAPQSCDRACLADKLESYLDAVAAHDPAQAPLLDGFRQTENSVVIPLGQGLWTSFEGFGPLDRRYYDPVTGQAAYMGVITHEGASAAVMLRLRVEDDLITEAEWQIAHESDPGIEGEPGTTLFDLESLLAGPPPERVVPPAERASRATLAAVANSYFDGITNASRNIALAAPGGCTRRENGFLVTGRPLAEGREWDGVDGKSDCRSGQGSFAVSNVAARRIHVIDEEAQVVVVSAVFIRSEGHPRWRNTFMDVMVMDGGRISDIYATMYYVDPERAIPNWPPYEGNFAR